MAACGRFTTARRRQALHDPLFGLRLNCRSLERRPKRWIAAVPDVTGNPPSISGGPLVNRDVLADVAHLRASCFGIQADLITTPFEGPVAQDVNLIDCESKLQMELIEKC